MKTGSKLVFIVGIALVFLGTTAAVAPHIIHAQTTDTSSTDTSSTDATAAKRAALQAQLNELDVEIDQTTSTLTTLKGQGNSIQNQINTLTAQIKKSQLELQATQVQIQALQSNIVVHSNTINTLSGQLTNEQESLAQIIRQTNEIDNYSLVEVALSSQDISSFFGDLDSFNAIQQELNSSYTQITTTRSSTEDEKNALEDQQTQAQQLASEESLEEQQIATQEAAQKKLLAQNKSQTAQEQTVYNIQSQTIAQIKAALFALAGGSGQISLPTAIALAKVAGADTGVDPALILGILKQETDIGANVGTANYQDAMSPTRDVPEFLFLTNLLGIDPNAVKVSAAPSYGWGGAMGPAQFIPSTWACYAGIINTTTGECGKGTDGTYTGPWAYDASKDRIAKLAGHPGSPSDPWNNTDAFVAVGLLMSDNGAVIGDTNSEREAALRYFAGWGNADNPAYAFYGDDVMAFTAQFESDINTLGGN
jgi:peptidoglycan hydrolase CwlO-like protein